MTDPINGVYAAALTPLDADLAPDHAAIAGHYRWLLANGCDGVAMLGTTGEANSFSVAERLAMIAAIDETDLPRNRLMIGTGCCALTDTVRLTQAALAIGVRDVLMLPPFYYKGVSDDGLFAAYAEILERIGSDRLRVYVYHFPKMTGLDMSVDLIVRLTDAFPGTIVGLKDSSGDWGNMQALLAAIPGFRLFAGTEQYLLDTLRAGGAGCISATANITSPGCAAVWQAWCDESDRADALQSRLTIQRLALQAYPAIPSLKEAMARHTGRADWRNMRPPLLPLGSADGERLMADIEDSRLAMATAA